MGNALFVVWRESLEAFLIIGILYAWLKAENDTGRGRAALLIGIVGGIVMALLLGWGLLSVQDDLSGDALEAFQIGMILIAAALITQMVLWMRKHGRHMKTQLQAGIEAASKRAGYVGIAVIAGLAVAREGAETVIFLYGLAQSGDTQALLFGASAGFVIAIITAWLAAYGLSRLNLGLLLQLSSVLLLIIASALLVAAVDRLIGMDWLPGLIDPLWDTSGILDDNATTGKLLADFGGYRARPALMMLLAWCAYWAAILFIFRKQPARA